jgi:hypothetical protein
MEGGLTMPVAAIIALASGALDLFMKLMGVAEQIKGTEKIPTPEQLLVEYRAMQAKIDAEK